MIRDKSIEGSFLEIELEPRPFPLRSGDTQGDAAATRLDAQLITLRFEMAGTRIEEIRAELVFDHASYLEAEKAGRLGLDAHARRAAMGERTFSPSALIHVLVRADLDRIGPHRFHGLDLMNNQNDLLEVLVSMDVDRPTSVYHHFETWTFITAQQKTDPARAPIGYDRAPDAKRNDP